MAAELSPDIICFRWDQEPAVVNAFYNPNTNDIGTLPHHWTQRYKYRYKIHNQT